ncbi:hypothetical protein TCAL_01507 [Tigriopus californicus]|uniref:RING-type domain-containing protein n=1 Tax=Tigriopus californicus TaxID=6832 RepID=A0A553P8E3_TIGCA|nr:hypothetical protein TCAL_01507 [Tigriopus californicus]|eukprot:TCALIF_01507-PA protein Name:"Similar to th Apoptosis 1 inhibitor (Drosophila melanogaster)" AED:0.23 eAED:0.23 QI:0/-1/0/1/-1/1/1/0/173
MGRTKFWGYVTESAMWFGMTGSLWVLHLGVSSLRVSFYPDSLSLAPETTTWPIVGSSRIAQSVVGVTVGLPLVWITFWSLFECVRLRQKVASLTARLRRNEKTSKDLHHEVRIKSQASQAQSRECTMCYAAPADMLFIPCLHLFACQSCSVHLTKCPYCKQPVQTRRKVFIMS